MMPTNETVTDETLQGCGQLRKVFRLLKRVSKSEAERDRSGNRELFLNQYAGLVLLSLFNPAMQSVRGLSDASALKRVKKRLGGGRVSIGSLSESVRVFDPELLEPIVADLLKKLPPQHAGPEPGRRLPETIPEELARKLTAVDGSVLGALPQIVNAVGRGRTSKWRLHLQFQMLHKTPESATLRPDGGGGENDERNVLAGQLTDGKVYIADGGYERYALFEKIVQAGSDYVIRCQSRPVDVLEERVVTAKGQAARVVSDQIVQLGQSRKGRRGGVGAVTHTVRKIVIAGRGQGRRQSDYSNSETIILLTSLQDVPAEIIAAIYTLRWSIELFFRFLKHVLGCRRLISHKTEGVTIQIYCALIACLLLARVTGRRMSRRAFNLVCLYLQGWADEDELIDGLSRIGASAGSSPTQS